MVYRRRVRRRRTVYRKRTTRAYRKRFSRGYRYSKRGQRLYLFKRFVRLNEITVDNINASYGAINFSLNDVPNYTEFTALYDMYKINCVKITFLPQMTQSVSIGSVNNPIANARVFTAIDYNDGGQPTSIDELREYQSAKYTTVLRPHKRVIFKPKILDTSSYSLSPWMSTAAPTTNYYGLKYAIEPMASSTTTSMAFQVECKYYMSFKNVK